MSKKVAIIMGSDSDLPVVKAAISELKAFGVPSEVHVMSAHRTPELVAEFATNAKENGFGVIIAAAGKAAHLAGVIAGSYHPTGHRHSDQVLYTGRTGCPAGNRTDADWYSGCNRCD